MGLHTLALTTKVVEPALSGTKKVGALTSSDSVVSREVKSAYSYITQTLGQLVLHISPVDFT